MTSTNNPKKSFTSEELERISELLSKKIGQSITISEVEQFESGYHSDGFKLHTKEGDIYFLKRIKSHDLGFELPERKVFSLLLSDSMGKRPDLSPEPIGVVLDNGDEEFVVPDLTEQTDIYHLQEYKEGVDSYASRILNRKDKDSVDNQDEKELEEILGLLTEIHSQNFPVDDEDRKRKVYNDGIRSVINHPELTVMFLESYEKDNPILPLSDQKKLLAEMFEIVREYQDRSDRLTSLHGDFWGSNIFFEKDGSAWVIDYSRIPWGDPAIDVGWFLAHYLWLYHETGNTYYKELGEKWLDMYEGVTDDSEIRKAVTIVMGVMGLVYTTPKFHPDLDIEVGKNYMDTIWSILDNRKFTWEA